MHPDGEVDKAAEAPASNPNYGTYTITRSNETDTTHALFVRFHMTGTALGNSDYRLYHSDGTQVSLTSSFDPVSQTNVYTGGVRIPANALSLTVELRPVDDHLAERDETAVFTIVPNDNVYYAIDQTDNGAAVTIEETTVVTLTTSDDLALEPCNWISGEERAGSFRLTVETTETDWQPIHVQFDVSGTADPGNSASFGDYHFTSSTGGSTSGIGVIDNGRVVITIPSGEDQYDFYVMPNADFLYEPDEEVVLEIIQAYSGSTQNQVNYDDLDVEPIEILQAPEFISGNDSSPLTDINTDYYIFSINENTARDFRTRGYKQMIVGTVTANIPSGHVEYSLEDHSDLFVINKMNGQLSLIRDVTDNDTSLTNWLELSVKAYNPEKPDTYDIAEVSIFLSDDEYSDLISYSFCNLQQEAPPLIDSDENEWGIEDFIWHYFSRDNPSPDDSVSLEEAGLEDDYRRALALDREQRWSEMKADTRNNTALDILSGTMLSEVSYNTPRDFTWDLLVAPGMFVYGDGYTHVDALSYATQTDHSVSYDIDGNLQSIDIYSIVASYHCTVRDKFAEVLDLDDVELRHGHPYWLTGEWTTDNETYTLLIVTTRVENECY